MSGYKRIEELGIVVTHTEDEYPDGVKRSEIIKALNKNKMDMDLYFKLFGCQTMSGNGAYPHDVEAVLERMMSGELTGTQKFWD